MNFEILTFNAQRGQRGLEFIEKLLTENQQCSYFFFQRFPEKWLHSLPKNLQAHYAPSFTDADNGTLTLSKEPLKVNVEYSSDLKVTSSQSFVIQKFQTPYGLFINTLPPYPEEGVIEIKDYEKHLKLVFAQTAELIAGDFHFEDDEIDKELSRIFHK